MKIRELVDALPSIQKIASQDLHAKTLYKVSLLMNRFDDEIKAYDITRRKLIEDYCEEVDGTIAPKKEFKEKFESEILDLLNTEVDIEDVCPVEIPKYEDIKISYTDLRLLEKLITIEFEEEEKKEEESK